LPWVGKVAIVGLVDPPLEQLSGALSNPQVLLELELLTERKSELLSRRSRPLSRSQVAPRTPSVASTVYKIISEATKPKRAKDIHRACEDELEHPVACSTVKACLSDKSRGKRRQFARVGRGLYALSAVDRLPSE